MNIIAALSLLAVAAILARNWFYFRGIRLARDRRLIFGSHHPHAVPSRTTQDLSSVTGACPNGIIAPGVGKPAWLKG